MQMALQLMEPWLIEYQYLKYNLGKSGPHLHQVQSEGGSKCVTHTCSHNDLIRIHIAIKRMMRGMGK